jgi:hypothetical protein
VYKHYAWFVRGAHHAALCRTSIEAVKRADRFARCVVVTDDEHLSAGIDGITLLRIERGLPIMLANLEAQVVVRKFVQEDDVYFLDTDTLLVRPFPLPACDIAFTWRDSIGLDEDGEKVEGIAQRMPYNYGVVAVAPTLGGLESLIWLRERVRVMHGSSQKWYGNQLAAAELAGARPASGTVIDKARLPWKLTALGREVSIAKLPCTEYNYTPQSPGEDVSGKFVLHFKGGKRALMEGYARALGLGWHIPAAAA